jgi:hypothetical protein
MRVDDGDNVEEIGDNLVPLCKEKVAGEETFVLHKMKH